MSLLEECIEALSDNIQVLSDNNKERILSDFENSFPFTAWGRIEWEKVKHHTETNTINEIIPFLNKNIEKYNKVVYVIWDEGTLPIIQSDLHKLFEVIDDVTAVSFDTWIFSPSSGFVIELFHDGGITLGLK